MTMTDSTILELKQIRQAFRKSDGAELTVLDNVDLRLSRREIVGLLGRSGSGKSSLLRIIAGLAQPAGGQALYKNQAISGPTEGIAMVFQSFALFPWLDVLANVELGLEAMGVPAREMRQRALAAIDLIGLDGFESAYPKELSGGMRQRVGFARALVVNPDILLLDEPFSALDVLTAETLRSDFLELWQDEQIKTSAVLMVTHNIEEAVLITDRVLIFSSNPGRITAEIPIHLAHPRDRLDPEFRALVDRIYVLMTTKGSLSEASPRPAMTGLGEPLPDVSTNQIAGMMEELHDDAYQGRADLPKLAESLALEIDELFAIVEGLQLLGFAEVADGDVVLKMAGSLYVESDTQERKKIFAEHALRHIGLIQHIYRVLKERPSQRAPGGRFVAELEDHLSTFEAERVLQRAINWGRYGELFSYDDGSGVLYLEDEHAP